MGTNITPDRKWSPSEFSNVSCTVGRVRISLSIEKGKSRGKKLRHYKKGLDGNGGSSHLGSQHPACQIEGYYNWGWVLWFSALDTLVKYGQKKRVSKHMISSVRKVGGRNSIANSIWEAARSYKAAPQNE